MKITSFFLVLFALFANYSFANSSTTDNPNKLIATFKGFDDLGRYMFEDEKKEMHYFEDLYADVSYDLESEEYLNAKFEVTWDPSEIDEFDDEGDPTGDTVEIKIIVGLKVISK